MPDIVQNRHPVSVASLERGVPVDEHALEVRHTGRGEHVERQIAQMAIVALVQDQGGSCHAASRQARVQARPVE